MIISRVHVQRYRSIFNETLVCGPLTILIGRNGAGKSAFVQALRLFMDTAASLEDEDYYNRDTHKEILIEVTFDQLTPEEQSEFASYLESGCLVVQRRFPGGDYFGQASGCEDFEPIRKRLRQKATKVGDVVPDLQGLVDSGRFLGLQPVKSRIPEELDRWEDANPSRCMRYFRAGLFQGPPNIAGGKLRNRSQFVYVAPVREAETDAIASGRQSALGALVAPLVEAITDKNTAVLSARKSLETGYGSYKAAVEEAPEKGILESSLTALLRRYEGQTAAYIQLALEDDLPLPPIKPRVWLVEDGFQGEVAKKGHGLQRLFIFSILELYEKLRTGESSENPGGNMILAIEEPELYQHPARARVLAKVLSDLSTRDDSRSFSFQIFLTTHSPYFVGIEDFQSIRRVVKEACTAGPMQTRVKFTTLEAVGNEVLAALEKPTVATDSSSWARLKSIIGLKASEGLFADGIILVEGDEDEAIVGSFAESQRVSLDAAGITIIPACGKTKLPNLLALYSQLGIKVFAIFDADCDKPSDDDAKTDFNMALMKMVGLEPEPRPTTTIAGRAAIWNTTFSKAVKAGFGDEAWDKAFYDARKEFSIPAEQAQKKFAVIWRTIEILEAQKLQCEPLESLWKAMTVFFGIDPEADG